MPKAGFTLIELLIVIGILGTLSVVLLLALNPAQQLARTRDSGRVSGVTQIGHALESYYLAQGHYPANTANWLQGLVDNGDLKNLPSQISANSGYTTCNRVNVNNWCYHYRAAPACAVVFTILESDSQKSRCPAERIPIFAYSTVDGRAGLRCGTNVADMYARANCLPWGSLFVE